MTEQSSQHDSRDETSELGGDGNGRSTHDLRAAANEALRLFREAQNAEKQETNPPEQAADNPQKPDEIGNTTHDLARAAYEATMRASGGEAATDQNLAKRQHFPTDMRLRLDMVEAPNTLIVDVQGEMVVGRADNVTDYIPDVDLTPHGAYRLGLSRRHAAFVREGDSLHVKDFKSRNGTFVNNTPVDKGSTAQLKDGDEVRFGNLAVRISFYRD